MNQLDDSCPKCSVGVGKLLISYRPYYGKPGQYGARIMFRCQVCGEEWNRIEMFDGGEKNAGGENKDAFDKLFVGSYVEDDRKMEGEDRG